MYSLNDLTPTEWKILCRNLAKCNPPPILHRYRGTSEYAITELETHQVYLASPDSLNDTLELRAPIEVDLIKLKERMYEYALEKGSSHEEAEEDASRMNENDVQDILNGIEKIRRDTGIISFSVNPLSHLMWGHYAESHKGFCIGYNTEIQPFDLARKVTYADPEGAINLIEVLNTNADSLSDLVSCRKGKAWEYEAEYRITVGPFPENHPRLLPVPPESIAEIRLGAKISPHFEDRVINVVRRLPHIPKLFRMVPDTKTFQMIEELIVP
jgi:hypothetical protein